MPHGGQYGFLGVGAFGVDAEIRDPLGADRLYAEMRWWRETGAPATAFGVGAYLLRDSLWGLLGVGALALYWLGGGKQKQDETGSAWDALVNPTVSVDPTLVHMETLGHLKLGRPVSYRELNALDNFRKQCIGNPEH